MIRQAASTNKIFNYENVGSHLSLSKHDRLVETKVQIVNCDKRKSVCNLNPFLP